MPLPYADQLDFVSCLYILKYYATCVCPISKYFFPVHKSKTVASSVIFFLPNFEHPPLSCALHPGSMHRSDGCTVRDFIYTGYQTIYRLQHVCVIPQRGVHFWIHHQMQQHSCSKRIILSRIAPRRQYRKLSNRMCKGEKC